MAAFTSKNITWLRSKNASSKKVFVASSRFRNVIVVTVTIIVIYNAECICVYLHKQYSFVSLGLKLMSWCNGEMGCEMGREYV